MANFRIKQGNMTVASANGVNAESEIMHYAYQLREDGDLTIQVQHKSPTNPGKWNWKRFMLMAQWPDENAVK